MAGVTKPPDVLQSMPESSVMSSLSCEKPPVATTTPLPLAWITVPSAFWAMTPTTTPSSTTSCLPSVSVRTVRPGLPSSHSVMMGPKFVPLPLGHQWKLSKKLAPW